MTTTDAIMTDANDGTKGEPKPAPGIRLTDAQLRARRARSIAIALALGVLAVLFYVVTLVKGPGVLVRPL